MSTENQLLKFSSHNSLISNQGKVLKIILSIVALIVIAIALVFYFTSGLSDAAKEQLSAIKSGNIETAYNMTSKKFQQTTSIDAFKKYIEQYPILKNYTSVSFMQRNVESGTGYLSGIIENAAGFQMKIEYQLVKENDTWKIQAIELTPIAKE